MAVLQKMRGWGIVLSILVALPLLLFIIDPQQIMQTVQSVSSKNDVGKIAGKAISYMDFQQDVDKFQTINEILTGNSTSEEGQKQARDAAWQNLVDKNLFIPNAEKAGINVGHDEMIDLTTGDKPSPLIANNGIFMDENGQFSPDRLRDFVQMVNDGSVDPRYKTYWDYLQSAVRTNQFYNKYNALFKAIEEDYADIPRKADRMKAIREDAYFNALQIKYAYAVTCHKAQGGQWSHVYIDQGYMTDDMLTPDYIHWLYTAITRGKERVYMVNWRKEQTQ